MKLIATAILFTIATLNCQAQPGKKLREKMAAAMSAKTEVTVEGDEGMVYIYKNADRTESITDITGLTKIYCTVHVHQKKFKQIRPSNTYCSYDLYKGSNCDLNDNASDECKKYFDAGSHEILENDGRGNYQLAVEKFDFEINLVDATEEDVKRNTIPEGSDFFVVVNIRGAFLASSAPLKFDIAAGADKYGEAEIERNKDLKLKKSVFKDADLENSVRQLFLERGMTEVTNISFYSGWTVERDAAGNILRRWCKLNLSGKEDGQCKFYWCRVWEEYQGGGKYQLPYDKNENFNRFNRELVPCENL